MERKVAVITGSRRGLGASIANALARRGYNVVINDFVSEDEVLNVVKNINDNYDVEALGVMADVSKESEVKRFLSVVKQKFGRVDVLINNAGIAQEKMFIDITEEDWNNMLQTNLTSAFYTIQEVLPNMIHNKSGCIINISSIWGITGASCEVHYSVSKAGIDALTKSLAKELGPSNIRVNSVAPGIIETDMTNDYTEEELEEIKSKIPLEKIGKPEDIAKCVYWLVDDNYTTGQIISPNGGWII